MRYALFLLSISLHAHFSLLQPPSAHSIDTGGKGDGPCGQAPDSNIVTPAQGGRPIQLRLNEFVFHPGHYRVALSVNSRAELPPDPIVTQDANGISISAVIENPAKIPVLADGLFAHSLPISGDFETAITLPNINCERCTLQVIEFMADHGFNPGGGYYYHHCADLRITADPALPPADPAWPRAAVPSSAWFPHIASGGGWSTTLNVINPSAASTVPIAVTLRNFAGAPLRLPLSGSLTSVLAPNATWQLATADPPDLPATGSVEMRSSGPISGYAVYRYAPPEGPAQELAAPLQSPTPLLILPFDNASGSETTFAITSSAPEEGVVSVTLYDDSGALLSNGTVAIGAFGHLDVALSTEFRLSAGKRGFARLQGPALVGFAFRRAPSGALLSLPLN